MATAATAKESSWMTQIVRKITYVGDGFRLGKRYSKTDSQ
jgi:hypothetical protein